MYYYNTSLSNTILIIVKKKMQYFESMHSILLKSVFESMYMQMKSQIILAITIRNMQIKECTDANCDGKLLKKVETRCLPIMSFEGLKFHLLTQNLKNFHFNLRFVVMSSAVRKMKLFAKRLPLRSRAKATAQAQQ